MELVLRQGKMLHKYSPQEIIGLFTSSGILLVANLMLLVFCIYIKRFFSYFVLAFYCLAIAITLMAILQYLYPLYVLCLTFIIFLVLYTLRFPILQSDFDKESFWLVLLLLLYLLGFQVQQDFVGGQDVRTLNLPLSRFLVHNPDFSTQWYTEDFPALSVTVGYPPLVTRLGALSFSLTGISQAWVAALVPSIFFTGFLFLLFKWCEEEGLGHRIPFILLLLSPIFVERSSWFSLESPLLLSTTLLVYMLYKFTKEGEESYLYYAMLGSSLGLLTKYTAMLFTALLILYLFQYKRWDKKIWGVFFLLHLPCLAWYFRNVYYFGNPVLPFLNFLTLDSLVKSDIDHYLQLTNEWHQEWTNKFFTLALLPLLLIWLVLFPLKLELRQGPLFRDIYFLFLIFLFMWLTYTPDIRYLFPFLPIAVVQLGHLIKKVPQWLPVRERLLTAKNGWGVCLATLSLFLLALGGQTLYIQKVFPDHITPDLRVLDFLHNQEQAGQGTRVFADTEHGLTWYGNLVVFLPQTPAFTKDFLKARKEKDFYQLFREYNISYVINHPWKSPWEENVFQVIESDRGHFVKLYEDPQWHTKLWKVVKS